MTLRKIYIAGPMTGYPQFNYPAFCEAAAKLRAEGWEVFSPAEIGIDRYGDDSEGMKMTRRQCLAFELTWIALQADAIYLLPGWNESTGARTEKALADALGLEIISADEG